MLYFMTKLFSAVITFYLSQLLVNIIGVMLVVFHVGKKRYCIVLLYNRHCIIQAALRPLHSNPGCFFIRSITMATCKIVMKMNELVILKMRNLH